MRQLNYVLNAVKGQGTEDKDITKYFEVDLIKIIRSKYRIPQ